MKNFTHTRIALTFCATLLALIFGGTGLIRVAPTGYAGHFQSQYSPDEATTNDGISSLSTSPQPSGSSTYYILRRDARRCASPLCGGFFIKRVNHPRTRCANGRMMAECYVAEVNWQTEAPGDLSTALVRGTLSERTFQGRGRFGILSVSETWQAAGNRWPHGDFYRAKDRGIRCITHPCMTHHESRLNTAFERNLAGVDLDQAEASDEAKSQAAAAMTENDGILVAGTHRRVTGPAGAAQMLVATQFYLRGRTSVGNKPCIKTGCSSQVCSDREVITTCEWRPQYACYQRARCERQQNGACGFTETPELRACLGRR
jgi:hypothetical protein